MTRIVSCRPLSYLTSSTETPSKAIPVLYAGSAAAPVSNLIDLKSARSNNFRFQDEALIHGSPVSPVASESVRRGQTDLAYIEVVVSFVRSIAGVTQLSLATQLLGCVPLFCSVSVFYRSLLTAGSASVSLLDRSVKPSLNLGWPTLIS